MVDTAIMGRFGDKADLAAVAIAAVAYSFIYWGFGFLRMSTTGLTAQANGQGDTAESRAILLRALMLGGAIGLGFGVAFSPAEDRHIRGLRRHGNGRDACQRLL